VAPDAADVAPDAADNDDEVTNIDLAQTVRYGSLADITARSRHVRFTPNNGRWAAHPSQHLAYRFMALTRTLALFPGGVAG
jgi:hypothetical protein